MSELIGLFGLLLLVLIPLIVVQYLLVIRPIKDRADYWLKQQREKDKQNGKG